MRFRQLPTLAQLDKALTRQWDLGGDPVGALATARLVSSHLAIGAANVDLEQDFRVISHAAEVFWDLNALDDARRLGALWRQTVIAVCEQRGIDATEPRIWSAILSARIEHRRRNYQAAVSYADFAMTEIRRKAGGTEKLMEMLRLGAVNAVLEMHCAALAIALPAGRLHFALRPTLKVQFLDRWIEEAKLILDRDMPPHLWRIHALVSQAHFALAELPRTLEREEWLDRLERFDDIVRPRHQRGQSTKRLRNVARARFNGDAAWELEEAELARGDLRFLPRHIEVLNVNGWWPVAVAHQR